jgi:ParB/RepB/Spo0J family partition protein
MTKVVVEGQRKDKMKHLRLEEIIVEDRFREDLGDIEEFVESIKAKGVIQPITVSCDAEGKYRLMAGGRRYEASTRAGLATIPAVIRDFEDEIDSKEIELFENIYRKDFTWAERARLTKAIDDLYQQKRGALKDWSGRKTAELLDRSVSSVARDLQLANAVEAIPELANCKTADDALKMIKKIEDGAIIEELRRRQDAKAQATGGTQFEKGLRDVLRLAQQNYAIGSVFDGMKGMKSNGNIQIIECDPPYGINLNEQKASKSSVDSNVHSYEEVPTEQYQDFLDKLTSELYRVAGKDCWCVFWYGPTWHQAVLDSLRRAGWIVDEIPAIWAKTQGQTLQPEYYFARGYEPFFLCRKGKPIMVERGRLNVFSFAGVPGKSKYHPTQRPTDLIKEIFTTLGAGRQHVFVPFLGSGATLLACYELGFDGFGFDLNPEYKDKFLLAVEDQTRKLFSTDNE